MMVKRSIMSLETVSLPLPLSLSSDRVVWWQSDEWEPKEGYILGAEIRFYSEDHDDDDDDDAVWKKWKWTNVERAWTIIHISCLVWANSTFLRLFSLSLSFLSFSPPFLALPNRIELSRFQFDHSVYEALVGHFWFKWSSIRFRKMCGSEMWRRRMWRRRIWNSLPVTRIGPKTLESSTVVQFQRLSLNCHWHSSIPSLAPFPMWGIWSLYKWHNCPCPFDNPFNLEQGMFCNVSRSFFSWLVMIGIPLKDDPDEEEIGSSWFMIIPGPCIPRLLQKTFSQTSHNFRWKVFTSKSDGNEKETF